MRGAFRGLTTVRLRYDLLLGLPSCRSRPDSSSLRGLLLPGFRRLGRPRRRRISLQCQLGNLHWRDSHPLEHQLASLHSPVAPSLVSVFIHIPAWNVVLSLCNRLPGLVSRHEHPHTSHLTPSFRPPLFSSTSPVAPSFLEEHESGVRSQKLESMARFRC